MPDFAFTVRPVFKTIAITVICTLSFALRVALVVVLLEGVFLAAITAIPQAAGGAVLVEADGVRVRISCPWSSAAYPQVIVNEFVTFVFVAGNLASAGDTTRVIRCVAHLLFAILFRNVFAVFWPFFSRAARTLRVEVAMGSNDSIGNVLSESLALGRGCKTFILFVADQVLCTISA